jgi:hypothetical protein
LLPAGDKITLHIIRNCDYRTEIDFSCDYSDQTYDIAALQTLDLYLVYWGASHIAHTMLNFGFAGGEQVCFSIETCKKVGEEYSAIKGFFRQYEKICVVADERDVVRLRYIFEKLPLASSLEDYEALLPWNIPVEVLAGTALG